MNPRNGFSDIFASLRSRNYRIYFIGQGISLIGSWMPEAWRAESASGPHYSFLPP